MHKPPLLRTQPLPLALLPPRPQPLQLPQNPILRETLPRKRHLLRRARIHALDALEHVHDIDHGRGAARLVAAEFLVVGGDVVGD